MGFLSNLFDSKPDYVRDIVKKIEGYSVDVNSEVKRQIESDAIYYAENKNNWKMIEEGYAQRKRDAEYYSLYFLYLAAKDALKSGKYHMFAGIVGVEGNLACGIGCDCLERLAQRGYVSQEESEDAQIHLKSLLSDVGIG